jgi:signal transduction histidine kinase/DNA-binding NarL/FixJ family response regulator
MGTGLFPRTDSLAHAMSLRTDDLFVERARLIFRNGIVSLAVHIVVGVLLVGVLWGRVLHASLWQWLIVLAVITALRAMLLVIYFRRQPPDLTLPLWLSLYTLGGAVAGLWWGLAIFLLQAEPNLITVVVLAFALGGLCLGALGAMGFMLRVYVPFLLAALLPLTVHFLWVRPEPGMSGLGVMLLAFIVAMVGLSASQRTVMNRAFTLAARLAEEKARAEASSRAKSEFLAYISHEIRTPMNGVLGMAEILLESSLNPDQRHLANTILRSGKSLLAVINDVLDISKIEAGKLTLEHRSFDPSLVVAEQIDLFGELAHRKQLALQVEVAADLPRRVMGDPQRFGQIISNLISNALKFTQSGHVQLKLSADMGAVKAASKISLVLVVEDSGVGVAPAAMARIFETFEQGDDSTARKFGGTGLGLAICKKLLDMMSGSIEVQSKPGQGAVFTVRMPVGVIEGYEFSVAASGLSNSGSKNSGLNNLTLNNAGLNSPNAKRTATPNTPRQFVGRVLLAEDNAVNQELVRRMLQALGCDVSMVDNGLDAVAAVKRERWDLVLMDGDMPKMNGLDATLAIRAWEQSHATANNRSADEDRSVENNPSVAAEKGLSEKKLRLPIVAITANAMMEDRQRYIDVGMNDYLIKPFSRQQLCEVLGDYLPLATTSAVAPGAAPANTPT